MIDRADVHNAWPMTFFSAQEFWNEFNDPHETFLLFTSKYVNAVYVFLWDTWIKAEASEDGFLPVLSSQTYGYSIRLFNGEYVTIKNDTEIMWLDDRQGVWIDDSL